MVIRNNNNNNNNNKSRLHEERNTKSSNSSNVTSTKTKTITTTRSPPTSTTTTPTTTTTKTTAKSLFIFSLGFKSIFIFSLGFLLGVLTTSLVGNNSNIKISIELMERYSKETTTNIMSTKNDNLHHGADETDYNTIFTSTSTESTSTTMMMTDPFDAIAHYAFERIVKQSSQKNQNQQQQQQQQQRNHLDITTWEKTTRGGLTNRDRILLSEIYRDATSVFEYGLGESTYIADHVGVPRYAGIDSDPVWIGMARSNVQSQEFRFYLADIGPTKQWGYPTDPNLAKHVYNYQLAPLVSELLPFDVYMVDGRFRFPCVLSSFLHASTRKLQLQQQQLQLQLQQGTTTGGSDNNAKTTTTTTTAAAAANIAIATANANTATDIDTIVLLHDCAIDHLSTIRRSGGQSRIDYHSADDLLDLIDHSGDKLCVFRRKVNTTNEQLLQRWMEFSDSIGR